MPTAQEALGHQIQGDIPAGGNIAQVNNFAPGVVEFVSVSTRTLNAVVDAAPATTVGGGILPFTTHVSASPYREYLVLPSTIQPGDTVSLTIDGGTHVVTLPTSFSPTGTPIQYDGDRINDTVPGAALVTGAGDELGGPLVHTQTGALAPGQRGLVVYEHQPETAGGGRMFVINPNQASGIPIPAFRTVTSTPATGTLVGEGILNTTSGVPYVWDGLRWNSIVPPSIITYPTDADVLNDGAAAPGTYAFSQASGNLFVRFTSSAGTDVWREIGIMKFPTEAGLLAATPADGSVAYAVDSGNYWTRIGTTWEPFGMNLDTEAHLLSVSPADGAMAYAIDTNRFWTRLNGAWQPLGVYSDTEAAIHTTSPQNGTVAYATDTGNMFARVNGGWSPVGVLQNTNAAILGSTEPDGTVAYSSDMHDLWARIDGAWQPISMPHDTTANILAATGWYDGARCYSTDDNVIYVRVHGAWQPESILHAADATIRAFAAQDHQLAVATDTGTVYLREGGSWIALTPRHFATLADVAAWTPPDGQEALVPSLGLLFTRAAGGWKPKSVWHANDAVVLARTDMIAGQIAVASDTNKMYTWDGAHWVGQPFRSYTTEALLDAATPPDGVVAVAADNGIVAFRAGGVWIKANRATNIIIQETTPTVALLGNLWFKPSNGVMQVYDGANWTQLRLGVLADLSDVSAAAPVRDQILTWDIGGSQWYPGNNPSVKIGAEPPVAERWAGMLFWQNGCLWVWDSAGIWVQV